MITYINILLISLMLFKYSAMVEASNLIRYVEAQIEAQQVNKDDLKKLPKVIEDIILSYVKDLQVNDNHKILMEEFKNAYSPSEIKKDDYDDFLMIAHRRGFVKYLLEYNTNTDDIEDMGNDYYNKVLYVNNLLNDNEMAFFNY